MKRRFSSTGSTNTTLIIGLLLILIVGGAVYILTPENKESILQRFIPGLFPNKEDLLNKNGQTVNKENTIEAPIPTPTIRPIGQGRVPITISTAQKPNFLSGIVDPFDPKKGERQTISVKVVDSEADVTSVKIILQSDNKEKTHDLQLTSGTKRDGEWSGSWIVDDTIDYKYIISFLGEDAKGNKSRVDDEIKNDLDTFYKNHPQ
jgi:hypothetical protein